MCIVTLVVEVDVLMAVILTPDVQSLSSVNLATLSVGVPASCTANCWLKIEMLGENWEGAVMVA